MATVITDEDTKTYVSENVRTIIDRLEWSQGKLARETGETPVTISNILRGKHVPSASILCRIAEALNVTIDSLLSPPGQPHRRPRRRAS